jgi:predicted amidohydrolase YtcJ
MLSHYNSFGITSICSGYNEIYFDFPGELNSELPTVSSNYDYETNLRLYQDLRKSDKLTVRVVQNIEIPRTTPESLSTLIDSLKSLWYSTGTGDEWIRIGAMKILLDGGILTGTAYQREPWGDKAQNIFGITDPAYRGELNYTREELLTIVKAANDLNWKFTAHCTGGGGVDLLLDVYDEVNKIKPIKERRFSIIHANFFTKEAIEKMNRLGVCADMQPAFFYKDADAMKYILGDKRIKTFQNYRSLIDGGVTVNGGSDHMIKLDANTSINPYNPFLAMWSIVTRTTERGTVILPEEAISREEALRMYTINNAFATFEESIKGSIEPGKLADMVILTDDILSCPLDKIKEIQSEMTILGGKIVYTSGSGLVQ